MPNPLPTEPLRWVLYLTNPMQPTRMRYQSLLGVGCSQEVGQNLAANTSLDDQRTCPRPLTSGPYSYYCGLAPLWVVSNRWRCFRSLAIVVIAYLPQVETLTRPSAGRESHAVAAVLIALVHYELANTPGLYGGMGLCPPHGAGCSDGHAGWGGTPISITASS